MNWFERWVMLRVIRRQVRQGYDHPQRIAQLYAMINQACRDEFTEDNEPTIRSALRDWFEDSLRM